MRKMSGWSVAFVLLCGLTTGCGGSSGGTPADSAALWNEAAEVLVTVKEEKDVDAAKPKLDKVLEKLKKNAEAFASKYPGATTGDLSKMPTFPEADVKKQIEAMEKFNKEAERVSKIKGGDKLVNDFRGEIGKMSGFGGKK